MRNRVLFCSDIHICHLAYNGFSLEQRLNRLVEEIKAAYTAEPFAALFLLGDYSLDFWQWDVLGSYLARGVSNTERFVKDYLPALQALPCEIRMIAGNHEQYGNAKWQGITGYTRQDTCTIGDTLFVLLDTFAGNLDPAEHSDGTYSGVDTDYLRRALSESDATRVVLCAHFFDLAKESEPFREILRTDKRIVAMVGGHDHSACIKQTDQSFGGVPVISDGHFSESWDNTPYGFRDMVLTDDTVATSFLTTDLPGKPTVFVIPNRQ